MVALGSEFVDDRIGERLPAPVLVRAGLMGADSQRRVEQQYALVCPAQQVAARGHRLAEVALDFLEDIQKRRRVRHTVLHREAESMRLPRFVIRVLPEDDDLHLVERTVGKGVEDIRSRRIDRLRLVFLPDEIRQSHEIVLFELVGKSGLPGRLYFYIHCVSYDI